MDFNFQDHFWKLETKANVPRPHLKITDTKWNPKLAMKKGWFYAAFTVAGQMSQKCFPITIGGFSDESIDIYNLILTLQVAWVD